LQNYSTIEFRLFRGTLKYNTFIAALIVATVLVDKIDDVVREVIDESYTHFSKCSGGMEIMTPTISPAS